MKKIIKYILILFIIIIFILILIFLTKKDSTLLYDHSNKTIDKQDLLNYEDINQCKVNNKLDGSAKKGEYLKVFNKDNIQDVYITIDENNLFYLFENSIDKPRVLINNIKIGDYSLDCSSIKTKGLTTLRSLWYTDYNKFSFTVNFKKYLKEQNLFGLTKVSFNNMYTDPSMSKEYISYYLFNEMGLDTVEYTYVNLYINNDYYGIYFMIEPIEKPLIKRTLKEKGDFLFKPEGEESSLIYNDELDKYLDSNGNYNFDSLVYNDNKEFIYPKNSNNILNKYKGIWEDDEESFEEIYNMLPSFFKTIKKLNYLSNLENKNTEYFEKELESIIDVDKLIKYHAINSYLVNTDGYINNPSRNYALYMNKDGFITIIPWDYNMILGASVLYNINDVINYDIYNPTINCNIKDKPLLNVILGNNNYKNRYNKYLKDISIILTTGGKTSFNKKYKKDNINNIINKYSKELIKNNNKCINTFYNSNDIKIAQKNIKEVFKLRKKSVLNQIDGNKELISSNIDLNSLGSLNLNK